MAPLNTNLGWPCLSRERALTGGAPPRVYWLVPSLPTMHTHTHIDSPFLPSTSHPLQPSLSHAFPFSSRASFIFFFRPRNSVSLVLFFFFFFLFLRRCSPLATTSHVSVLRLLHPLSSSSRFPDVVPLRSTDPRTTDLFPSFVTSFQGIPVCSQFPTSQSRETHCQSRVLCSTSVCKFRPVIVHRPPSPPSPPCSFLVHALNRFYTL